MPAERLRLYTRVLDDLTRQIRDLMAERLEDAQCLGCDQGGLFLAHRRFVRMGDRGEFFQFPDPPRFCDRRRRSIDRVCRYGLRRAANEFA